MNCLVAEQGEAGDHCGVEPAQARPRGPGAQTYLYLFLIKEEMKNASSKHVQQKPIFFDFYNMVCAIA